MKKIIFALLFSAVHFAYAQTPKVVIAYVTSHSDFRAEDIDAKIITHINYAFANVKNNEIVLDNTGDAENFKELHKLRKANPTLKLLVSVGGWGWSNGFSDAALTPESRKKFALSAIKYVRQYDLDGIDLDWEYPGQEGAGNIHRPADKQNFTLLLAAVRAEFEKSTAVTKKPLLLSIATGGDDDYMANTELNKAHQYLDYVNIMSYDLYNGNDHVTGHHAGLYLPKTYTKKVSVDHAVQLHLAQGIPASKIVLGIPFYGRVWKSVTSANKGFNQKSGTGGEGIDYKAIFPLLSDEEYAHIWDEQAQAPYLWNENQGEFISYEDTKTIAIKCEYIKKLNLAGAMFWEFSGDYESQLLKAIGKGLK